MPASGKAFVPPVKTPARPDEMMDAIADAYEAVCGGEIPSRLLLALTAQSALETGRWAAMWNNNPGNIRGSGDAGWTSFEAGEIIDGKSVVLPPGVDNKFAAYGDRLAGARGFVSFLCTASHPPAPNRFQGAIDAAMKGDLEGYVHGLKAGGYFTAEEGTYFHAEQSVESWLERLPEAHAWAKEIT